MDSGTLQFPGDGFEYSYQPRPPTDTNTTFGNLVPPPYSLMPYWMPYPIPPPLRPTIPTHPSPLHESCVSSSRVPISALPPWLEMVSVAQETRAPKSRTRKLLTYEDRRKICLYHEQDKTAKQWEIGGKYGIFVFLEFVDRNNWIALFGVDIRYKCFTSSALQCTLT